MLPFSRSILTNTSPRLSFLLLLLLLPPPPPRTFAGIHYDLLLLSQSPPPDALSPDNLPFCETIFPTSQAVVLAAASEIAGKLKARHYYTDTAKFDLRCGTCGLGLKGEKGAREHAKETGHVDFG